MIRVCRQCMASRMSKRGLTPVDVEAFASVPSPHSREFIATGYSRKLCLSCMHAINVSIQAG